MKNVVNMEQTIYHIRRAKQAEESESWFIALDEYQEARRAIESAANHSFVPLACKRISAHNRCFY